MVDVSSGRANPYAVFRSGIGRYVAIGCALTSVVVFGIAAASLPTESGMWSQVDRALVFLFGVFLALGLWRWASVKAVPSPEGLTVRNLFVTRRLEWAEIVGVQYDRHVPWAQVDLVDTDTVSIMAIQRADGARAQREAARLAALIHHHGSSQEPPRRGASEDD